MPLLLNESRKFEIILSLYPEPRLLGTRKNKFLQEFESVKKYHIDFLF